MSKKVLFVLLVLGSLQHVFVGFLEIISFFDVFASLTLELISFTSQPAYKMTMLILNFLCGAVLIVLARKSQYRFPFIIGAIYSGIAWLLFFCISRQYRQTNDKLIAIPTFLQFFMALMIGLNLTLMFASEIFTFHWRLVFGIISLFSIRIYLAVSIYKMIKSGYKWLAGAYLILGELGLLLGEIISVIYINCAKKMQDEVSDFK